ncbi:MAG: threonylcarbamoyl-AMP synthase [Flavobacteriaceae bacterium]|nr:threonylcarbamoyl-AMP synthase [Bacteroidia bacterium]NNK86875.1 threonylcarbamoyl-AMP synthase [Flavobacteriaceae bacterium]
MARLIKIFEENPSARAIAKVVDCLRSGGLVIYPTDTVYGLGCDITKPKALERIARIKGIKLEKANLSFICHDLSNLSDYVRQIDNTTFKLLKRWLPGPYTFVLPSSKSLPRPFKNKKTVGIRIPDNNIIREMVRALGNPILTTSIYDEDEILEYTTDPELIHEKWDRLVDMVVDGGYGGNVPSTVIDLTTYPPETLREGKGTIDIF